MIEHTKEPWYVGAQNDGLYIVAGDQPAKSNDYPMHNADRTLVAVMKGDTYDNNQANARRIMACMNACRGIENDELEKVPYAALLESHRNYERQCDELLAALKKIVSDGDYTAPEGMKRIAKDAIAKADAPLDIPSFLRNQSNLAAEKAKAACQCKVTNLDGLCVECGKKVAE